MNHPRRPHFLSEHVPFPNGNKTKGINRAGGPATDAWIAGSGRDYNQGKPGNPISLIRSTGLTGEMRHLKTWVKGKRETWKRGPQCPLKITDNKRSLSILWAADKPKQGRKATNE
jgi:hypothetical protein